jgi:Leucine Rich repeats (2 copies)
LASISVCPALRYLDLSDNNITSIAEDFDGHPNLIELDLGINQLTSLAKMGGMPSLKRLQLNNNKLKELTGLEAMSSLTYLCLKGNVITGFEEGFPEFENLYELDLSGTMISKISEIEKLAVLPNLKVLRIKKTFFVENHLDNYIYQILSKLMKLE